MLFALLMTFTHVYAQVTPDHSLKLVPYGFLKASAMFSDRALASYNNINLSAPTLAIAQTREVDRQSRTSFQAAQSRLGFTVEKNDHLTGRFEFDFIDFSKSSPTTQMLPRVRRALVTYRGEGWHMDVGQDWDLFSPTNPYTYDIVGLYFNAGNSGFQRQQLQYHRNLESWQLSAALGMAGNNPGITDGDLETANTPSLSVRAKHTYGPVITGLSAIYSRLNYASSDDSWHDVYGVNAFFEHEVPTLGIKAELFYGQNLANIGALTLARGRSTANVREWGGFLSANWLFMLNNKVFAGVGLDRVTNKENVANTNITPATGAINASGAFSNFLSRVGWEHQIEKDFSWMFEASRYQTASILTAARNEKTQVAHSIETGVLWKF